MKKLCTSTILLMALSPVLLVSFKPINLPKKGLILFESIAEASWYLTPVDYDPETPFASNDVVQTVVNKPVHIYPMDNDEMNGEMLDFGIEVPANHGEVGLFGQRFVYVPAADFCGETDQFTYYITNASGTSTAIVEVQILCDELVAYSGFSPNGDHINDKFIVEGIDKYPKNQVLIFNRWGSQIYAKGGYDNNDPWDGSFNGELVTSGTYFYVIYDGEGRRYSGYVEVVR